MCRGGFNTLNGGIPLVSEIHNQFSPEVQQAFEVLHRWWSTQENPKKSQMPENVHKAYDLLNETEIPGWPGFTIKDSCYMRGVNLLFGD